MESIIMDQNYKIQMKNNVCIYFDPAYLINHEMQLVSLRLILKKNFITMFDIVPYQYNI